MCSERHNSPRHVPGHVVPSMEAGEEWFSVILHFSNAAFSGAGTMINIEPPISSRFELSDDFWIEHLDPGLARAIVTACSPSNFQAPVLEQQDHTYAFVKKTRLPGLFDDFGGINELAALVAMSRLIHFTTTGLRYAARVSTVNGDLKQIISFQPRGVIVDVFCSKVERRDWLTETEAQKLRTLMPLILTRKPLPKRIHNAHWHHEYAMRTYYVDHRWVFVTTGLEALMNTAPYQGQKRFVSRVGRLAKIAGVTMSDGDLERGYALRSGLVHGQQFLSEQTNRLSDADANLYDQLEETLRRTVLHAFEDDSFAAHFRDENSIDAFLPYP
jgi:hypothetical protein